MSENQRRGDWVKDQLTTQRNKHPGFQIILCHPKHTYSFQGARNTDWGHDHEEYQRSDIIGTIGFEIYWFRKGTFENLGDGGYINWAYTGSPRRDGMKLTY